MIVCTDHGHYLGERDIWGKPAVPVYETMGHIPLLVAWPAGRLGRGIDALTTTVDLFATIADTFGVRPAHRTHGRSLVPLLRGDVSSVRDWALTGIWGREVQVTDGRITYARAPVEGNRPLSLWSNRWSTMPVPGRPELRLPQADRRARLDFMPGSQVPVIRQPFTADDPVPYWAAGRFRGDQLYDLHHDPDEQHNLVTHAATGREVADAADLMRHALVDLDTPDDQLVRLGLR